MKNAAIARQIQKLQALQKNPEVLACAIEVQSQWARYLCILVAGLLENALTELYSAYSSSCANKQVARYANARLATIQNPNSERFLQVARDFSPDWADDLKTFMENDGGKDAIDSIMNLRNQIAHGKDTGVTLARLDGYFKAAITVLERIEGYLNP